MRLQCVIRGYSFSVVGLRFIRNPDVRIAQIHIAAFRRGDHWLTGWQNEWASVRELVVSTGARICLSGITVGVRLRPGCAGVGAFGRRSAQRVRWSRGSRLIERDRNNLVATESVHIPDIDGQIVARLPLNIECAI